MSSIANWAYTSIATIWKEIGADEYDKPVFSAPVHIICGYGSELKDGVGTIGTEIVIKLVFWTEYSEAKQGDFIAIGKHEEADPFTVGADKIRFIKRDEDLFEHIADDYTLVTAV